MWNLAQSQIIKSITLDIFNDSGAGLGKKKFYTMQNTTANIGKWIAGYRIKNPPLDLAMLNSGRVDFQNQKLVYIKHYVGDESHALTLTLTNLIPCAVFFAVRHCIKATWINDRDQFLAPNKKWEKDEEFQNDCLIFMLFHGQNRITAKEGINHFIPFSEKDLNAGEAFESHFMLEFIQGKIKLDSTCHTDSTPCHTDSTLCHTERSEVSHTKSKRDFSFATQIQNDNTHTCKNDKTKSKLLQQSLFNDEQDFIPTKPLEFGDEAKEVLQAGKELFKHYHGQAKDSKDYNANAALYDIKAHFQGFNDKGKMNPPQRADDETYKEKLGILNYALKNLAKKIEVKVYEYAFLLP
ncbi:hypothetical protein [Helicobacter labetoulli]|uniref:hypothetical protein n=1 Tax=Helicobacter labetoulli TaxID=2315333 RepID=UPI001FC91581|nr:hypothetical protein [Helicobacter labetoulli]